MYDSQIWACLMNENLAGIGVYQMKGIQVHGVRVILYKF